MDYGPKGSADVTENLTESVPCGPVLHDPAEPEQDMQGLPYLHIKARFQPLDSPSVKEVLCTSQLLFLLIPEQRYQDVRSPWYFKFMSRHKMTRLLHFSARACMEPFPIPKRLDALEEHLSGSRVPSKN